MEFIEIPAPERKTKIIQVRSKSNDDMLGVIQWYTHWRQYVFITYSDNILLSTGCLKDITKFIENLMEERKKNK